MQSKLSSFEAMQQLVTQQVGAWQWAAALDGGPGHVPRVSFHHGPCTHGLDFVAAKQPSTSRPNRQASTPPPPPAPLQSLVRERAKQLKAASSQVALLQNQVGTGWRAARSRVFRLAARACTPRLPNRPNPVFPPRCWSTSWRWSGSRASCTSMGARTRSPPRHRHARSWAHPASSANGQSSGPPRAFCLHNCRESHLLPDAVELRHMQARCTAQVPAHMLVLVLLPLACVDWLLTAWNSLTGQHG